MKGTNMQAIPLFDLHCDTLYESHKQNVSLIKNDLHLDFTRLSEYTPFCQILAMWSDRKIDEDTAYSRFFSARDKLTRELALANEQGMSIHLCRNADEPSKAQSDGVNAVFLAVEGGKLIGNDLSRLDELYRAGVRFLTLVWNDPCKIGGVNGTDEGLTEFGVSVVKHCFSLGIIPDLSHASDKMCDEVIALCEELDHVCIATHSNSRAVCEHSRNLTDERFCRISKLGGIVGISLAPMHLTHSEECTVYDIIRHIEHYVSIGGENTVCLGCDLDGVETLPDGICGVSDLYKIADALGRINYTEELIKKIFYANARNFISLWLK